MSPTFRLGLVAFCCDVAVYVIMSALPFRLLGLGAGSLLLGAVPALYSAPYAVLVLFTGHRSDSISRSVLIRIGTSIAALAALLLALADRPLTIVACVPLLAIGLSMVWPSLQAAFSELPGKHSLSRQISVYNLSWSSGKSLGFLIGGSLVAGFGAPLSIACAAFAYMMAAITVPRLSANSPHATEASNRGEQMPATVRRAFLRSAWLVNGVAFGLGAVLNHHLPRLMLRRGDDADRFGLLLGAIFIAQTLSFVLLRRWRGWHYRLRLLIAVQITLASLAILLPRSSGLAALLGMAIALGLCLGFCYQSSLYYSLHAPSGRGRQAGFHEASLGIAAALLPLAGGLWVRLSGNLLQPFLLAGLALLGSLLISSSIVLRARRRA